MVGSYKFNINHRSGKGESLDIVWRLLRIFCDWWTCIPLVLDGEFTVSDRFFTDSDILKRLPSVTRQLKSLFNHG